MKWAALDHQSLHQCPRLASGMHCTQGNPSAVVFILGLLIITIWSNWSTLADLLPSWQSSDDYSAGLLVPLIAVFLLWREGRRLRQCVLMPCWSGGIALLVLGGTAQIVGFLSMRPAFERYALVLTLAGAVLLVAGWQVFRRLFWILLFLFLMVPLPGRIHSLISLPLQNTATTGSVFLLEAFGTSVNRQGNVIMLNGGTPVGVAEACSGLRMLVAFVIAAAFIAYMVKRPRWQKAVLLMSSIPVAVACNVIRIFVTGMLMLHVGSEVAQKFFHDIGGFVMIAIAVSLLFGEIRLMDQLIVSESNTPSEEVIISARSTARLQARVATE